jgi:hypothetical protein
MAAFDHFALQGNLIRLEPLNHSFADGLAAASAQC